MDKVGIVLVNYKDYAQKFLADCRSTLENQSYPRDDFIVYIIDNASSPESLKYLHDYYPQAVVIAREDGNYSAANNAGARQAIADGCQFIVIVNMDVEFDQDWLTELVLAIKSDDKIGIVQSKILLYPKNEEQRKNPLINSVGNKIHYLGFGFTQGYNEPQTNYPDNKLTEITGYASGCSFIMKKQVFEKVDGYDEEFYMYHDDLEISWKARLAGYKIMLAPKSIIYHKYEFSRSVRMVYYMERNRYLSMFIFYKFATLLLILPAMIIMEFGMLFFSLINKWFKTKIKVNLYFLKISTWKFILRKRKQVNCFRKLKDKDLVKNFSGQVLFQEIQNPLLKYVGNPLINIYWKIVRKIVFW